MKEIQLTQGYFTQVDDEDYEYLNQFKWHVNLSKGNARAKRYGLANKKYVPILMHRELMNFPDKLLVDHIDGNPLNNQKSNLRICTHAENRRNMKKRNKRLYKGVYLTKNNKFFSAIKFNRKSIWLGIFNTEEDAALAYNQAAIKYFKEFACLNKIGNK